MILIADSGSTKTDWRLIDEEGNIHQAQTIGLNPYFINDERIAETLRTGALRLFTPDAVKEVFFYGSGLGAVTNRIRLESIVGKHYKRARVHIEHDLLGACRALCGNDPGVAVILGTGANTAVYDGAYIVQQVKSLGYLLGDEGSGAELGRRWMSAFLNGRVPEHLDAAFRGSFSLSFDEILERVYRKEQPNRFLASVVPFLKEHKEDPYVAGLLQSSFELLFEHYLLRYPQIGEYPIHFCGSIAWYFQPFLQSIAEDHGLITGQFLQSPIAALTLYHLER